jgi:MoaA/NifB/PqqE/SkfB family radical SAM enzyme
MELATVALPEFLQIEPVGQCNLRCQMCPIQFRRDGPPHGPPAFMDYAVFERLLAELPGLKELHLQGLGEPMMHPRFFDMVAEGTRHGIKVSTNTNLTLLNPRRAQACIDSGLAELHASLDAASAEIYERIRVRASFERVVANLEGLMQTRRRLGSSTPKVRLIMVLMRQNLHELPPLVDLAQRLGIDVIFVQHLCHDFGESSLPERYRAMRDFVDEQTLVHEDPARIAGFFAEARCRAARHGIDLRLPTTTPRSHPPGTPGRERCNWPWTGAYVSYQGLAMPCCMVATPDRANLGSMAELGVAAIWEGPAYQGFRAALSSETPPEVCRSCAIYQGTF